MRRFLPLIFFFFFTACAPQKPTTIAIMERETVNVYVDAFGEASLSALYTCAERSPVWLVARTPSADAANLIVRVNPDLAPDTVAYPIGEIEFVVVVNDENPVERLSADDVRAIYTGQITNWAQLGGDDLLIQLWVYNPEMGLNGIMLGQGSLSSLAYQAQSPRMMRGALTSDPAAVGILPVEMVSDRAGIRRIPFEKIKFHLLIVLPEETNGLKSLVACLQEK